MNTYDDFRNVIQEERDNLTRLSDYWNNQVKFNKTLSKDNQGRIRAAVGKTRLLLSEKFKQFEGLIEQSENNTAEKEITINDLQGFWDLVLIQINQVKEMFRGLDKVGGKISSEARNNGLYKNKDSDVKEGKSRNDSRRKSSIDYLNETERRINEAMEEDKKGSEAGDLKG